jgi:hypothetical protein
MECIEKSILYHFHNLVGVVGDYEGANEQEHTFKFDNILWLAVEDEMDGYRSMLDYVLYADANQNKSFIAQKNLAKVRMENINSDIDDEFSGYVLRDIEDEHIWLRIGTSYADQWYPYIIFQHIPKKKHV